MLILLLFSFCLLIFGHLFFCIVLHCIFFFLVISLYDGGPLLSCSGVTLLFEHLPSWASEIELFEIFSVTRKKINSPDDFL